MIVGEREHEAAVVAAIVAAGAPARTTRRYGTDARPPSMYVEVLAAQKVDDPSVFRGQRTLTDSFRVLTRAVAETRENAQEMRRLTVAALDYKPLLVGGLLTTPLYRAVSDEPIVADDGWWSGVQEWAYAYTPPLDAA